MKPFLFIFMYSHGPFLFVPPFLHIVITPIHFQANIQRKYKVSSHSMSIVELMDANNKTRAFYDINAFIPAFACLQTRGTKRKPGRLLKCADWYKSRLFEAAINSQTNLPRLECTCQILFPTHTSSDTTEKTVLCFLSLNLLCDAKDKITTLVIKFLILKQYWLLM